MNQETGQVAAQEPPPPGGITDETVEQLATRMSGQLRDLHRAQRNARRFVLFVTLVILIEVIVFAAALYFRVTSNFDPQKIAQTAQIVASDIWPQLFPQIRRGAQEVAPVYWEQLSRRLAEKGSEIGHLYVTEAQKVPEQLQEQVGEHLEASLARIIGHLEPTLKTLLPELEGEEGTTELAAKLQAKLAEESVEIERYLNGRIDNLGIELDKTLLKLDNPPASLPEGIELERHFVHLLLQWADLKLMTAGEAKPEESPPATNGEGSSQPTGTREQGGQS